MSNFFENLSLSSSYEGLSPHQIWFNLDQGKQSYVGGGGVEVENVLNRLGETGLTVPLSLPHILRSIGFFKFPLDCYLSISQSLASFS